MTRCPICGLSKACKIEIKEPRYFVGHRFVCSECFERWAVCDYDTLDKKAISKLGVKS